MNTSTDALGTSLKTCFRCEQQLSQTKTNTWLRSPILHSRDLPDSAKISRISQCLKTLLSSNIPLQLRDQSGQHLHQSVPILRQHQLPHPHQELGQVQECSTSSSIISIKSKTKQAIRDLQPHVQWKVSSIINGLIGPWLYLLLHGTLAVPTSAWHQGEEDEGRGQPALHWV